MKEKEIWKSSPSQLTNIFYFIFLSWTIIFPIWRYLTTKFTNYKLTNKRLIITTGILSRQTEEIELYRVRDYSVSRPFPIIFFKLGHINLATSDKNQSTLHLKAIKDPENVKDLIRENVEIQRQETGTKEVDFT